MAEYIETPTSSARTPTTLWSATRPTSRPRTRRENAELPGGYGPAPAVLLRCRSPSASSSWPRPAGDRRGAGFVGQITANSFMKREFGKKLIEEYFPEGRTDPRHRHLRRLHPWPRHADRDPVRPQPVARRPADPCGAGCPRRASCLRTGKGLVWRRRRRPGRQARQSQSDCDQRGGHATCPGIALAHHPWSLGGGGAGRAERGTVGRICQQRAL